MRMSRWAAVMGAVCMGICGTAAAAQTVNLDNYLRQQSFGDIKLSPTGEYVAATVPMERSTALVILRTADSSLVGSFRPPTDNHADAFDWVSNDRVLIGLAEKFGSLDEPQRTGELYALNADGKGGSLLVGYRVQGNGPGSHIQPKKVEAVAAFLSDELPDDDRNVLVAVWPFHEDPFTRAERLDVVSGRRTTVARSPVRRARFLADAGGQVRFAYGAGTDNVNKLYYREGNGESWALINDEAVTGRIETALGFSADGTLAYLRSEQAAGPDAIVSWNPATGQRQAVLRDETVDPDRILYRPGTRVPVGALFMGATPRTRFFDDASADARLYRSLEAGLGGPVFITSSTRDGSKVLVESFSARNPGDFYVFDTVARKATHLISRSEWLDTDHSATVRAVAFTARDGLPLHGFLTLPHGSEGRNLPMVVMPHGGPFGVADTGRYDTDAQLLAAAGYAVMQVNFRGSSNYGRAHQQAGARQWGGAMQDDVTDATRWAIDQGVADRQRICIYGASYGGYAALMGAAREPALYQCAAGYVGVYDLPMMFVRGDIQDTGSGQTYLREWLGDPAGLAARSPVNLAAQIRVPVFLAAGGADKRAPVQHTERMEAALTRTGVPVQSLYYRTEGHGFYTPENRRAYYTQLLAFLSQRLGGATAAVPAAAGAAGKAP